MVDRASETAERVGFEFVSIECEIGAVEAQFPAKRNSLIRLSRKGEAFMRHIRITAVSAAMVLVSLTNLGPAFARPPTVGINPGYDRRLTASRNGQAGTGVT